ncbi:DUF4041 domain-containing protein [Robiginitalea sp. SC105]|uniref:DUF4041 domain-containing protein n=1 Tax=Robiginitalea sp. SC105 TaxID=2762332 RepID=UPI00163B21EB|nr:DUF4041 domain-containing protein [Robiginitalea sp. SC105]MBC2838882.1 DUF4041 domain-containing protein [Robiginitalea sp. SC105]
MDLFKNKKLKQCEREKQSLLDKYSEIIDLEDEIEKVNKQLSEIQSERARIAVDYERGKKKLEDLVEETKVYESKLDLVSFGHYDPIFNFDDSDSYKRKIEEIVAQQKSMIKSGLACYEVEGHEWKSRKAFISIVKTMMKAFNGECNNLISRVKWNNILTFQKRIEKEYNSINRINKNNNIEIKPLYKKLKIDELRATYEHRLKKHQEKEKQREERARIREEERAQRDFEIARKKAEKEEAFYQMALEKAKKDLGLVSGEKLSELESQITNLEEKLKFAHEQRERAISMAQQTKSGYVYVISNVGSFGEDIYKIGLTRRLEPLDRVRELGDSSVPFRFDVHAMIYSNDAPALEYELHQTFKDKSLNLVNFRKEFFKVSLDEIERAVNKIVENEVEFVRVKEAQEYRESISIREKVNEEREKEIDLPRFPNSIF